MAMILELQEMETTHGPSLTPSNVLSTLLHADIGCL
ncbi:noursin family copper-binding tricyclic lanthipeptide [Streptomyces sp. HJ7]